MGPDLKSKRWIVAKGLLFALIVPLSGVPLVLIGNQPLWIRALLLVVCIWASCRFITSCSMSFTPTSIPHCRARA